MAKQQLTIGMACYDDLKGAWFTIQAIRRLHPEVADRVVFVIVDNYPPKTAGLEQFAGQCGAKYVHLPDPVGTSPPRDRVFREAETEWVMCVDSHVLIAPGAIRRLMDLLDQRGGDDLWQGPVRFDGGGLASHFDPIWRDEMLGIWALAWQCPCGQWLFSVHRGEAGDGASRALYHALEPSWSEPFRDSCPTCGSALPTIAYEGHEAVLAQAGFRHAGQLKEPFEIPAQGLGLFACRRDAWLGFHPLQRGFGGEEWYIHEKFRRAGRKCWCVPWLVWDHYFGPQNRAPVTTIDKMQNYVLELRELGLDVAPVYEHFVLGKNNGTGNRVPQADWDWFMADPEHRRLVPGKVLPAGSDVSSQCANCGGAAIASLESWYADQCQHHPDISEHLPRIRQLADQCRTVAELGAGRGGVTAALLASQAQRVITLDLARPAYEAAVRGLAGHRWQVILGDSRQTDLSEEVDLLVIDTVHRADYLMAELERHAPRVRRWIVLHDTEIFGEFGESRPGDAGPVPGLRPAMRRFLQLHPEWSLIEHRRNQYGLSVLSRDPRDKPNLPSLARQAFNFAKALGKHLASGARGVTEEELAGRLDICAVCEHRVENRCAICGCYLIDAPTGAGGKAEWADQSCPLGKWLPIEQPAGSTEQGA